MSKGKGLEKVIHIITAVHNRKEITCKFVELLKKQTYSDIHLILVDDGSTDGTSAAVKQLMPDVTIIIGNGNLWWGGALHKAYKWVKMNLQDKKDEYVLFSNDDVRFENDYLEKGISFFNKNNNSLIMGEGYSINDGRLLNTLWNLNYRNKDDAFVKSNDRVGSCCSTRSLFLNVKIFLDIGGFHPLLLPHYQSDYEWTIRAARKGYMIKSFENLSFYFDENTTGENFYETLTIKKIFSKRSVTNPIFKLNFILLSTPKKYILFEIAKQVRRYLEKKDLFRDIIKR